MKRGSIIRDSSGEVDLSRLATLIVDDNDFIRKVISRILRVFGAKSIGQAKDTEAAFGALGRHKVDLIICDYLMAPMNGLDFTRQVRAGDSKVPQEIPIIMLTAHTELEKVIEMRDAGVTELLAKPVSASALLDRVISTFEAPRSFVRSDTYTGPDRRRQSIPYDGEERRDKPKSK